MRKTSGRGLNYCGHRPVRTLPTYKQVNEGVVAFLSKRAEKEVLADEHLRVSKRKARALDHCWYPEPYEAEDVDVI